MGRESAAIVVFSVSIVSVVIAFFPDPVAVVTLITLVGRNIKAIINVISLRLD